MPESNNKFFTEKAVSIGERIYKKRIETVNGIYWKTIEIDFTKKSKNRKVFSENVYSGTSGIALFFIYLYRITSDKKYINAGKRAMDYVLYHCKKKKTTNYSFLTGRSGIAYVLLELSKEIEGDYLKEAVKIAGESGKFIEEQTPPCEYINGVCGTIIVLLKLHEKTEADNLLKIINDYIKYLLDRYYYNLNGIHWDRNHEVIKSLCGFSHGASGIGYTFLMLGYYFKNKAFIYLAEQCIAYETKQYNPEKRNWPDFRKTVIFQNEIEELKKAIETKNYDFFYKESTAFAWCHGAPGIGLTRLRFHEYLGGNTYRQEFMRVNRTIISSHINGIGKMPTFNLCHGLGGNFELPLESRKYFSDKKLQRDFIKAIDLTVEHARVTKKYLSGWHTIIENAEDISLFMGNAGIAYFYLRLAEPEKTESILIPKINSKISKEIRRKYEYIDLDIKKLRETIISKSYPETFRNYCHSHPEDAKKFLAQTSSFKLNEISLFKKEIENKFTNNKAAREKLYDTYKYENEIIKLDSNNRSFALSHYRRTIFNNRIKELFNYKGKFVKCTLQINPDVKITKYRKQTGKTDLYPQNGGSSDNFQVLFATEKGVVEIRASDLSITILRLFKKNRTIHSASSSFEKSFGKVTKKDRQEITEIFFKQLKILINEGVLIES